MNDNAKPRPPARPEPDPQISTDYSRTPFPSNDTWLSGGCGLAAAVVIWALAVLGLFAVCFVLLNLVGIVVSISYRGG
jgi:hypothetical protein